MTTEATWAALRETIRLDRGIYCEVCGCAPFTELHHCLIHKMKGHEELNCVENLMAVCADCHPYQNGFKARCRFWRSQVALYGRERMQEWLGGLGLKIIPRFE